MKIIDISLPLNIKTPLWPNSPEFKLKRYKKLENGDDCNNSYLSCDLHFGTHIDAPSHFLINGATIEQIPLGMLIGSVRVCSLQDISVISARDLEALDLSENVTRLLLKTDNSKFWRSHSNEFRSDYTGLSSDAAQWIVERGIQLLGIDYLSIAGFEDTINPHRILLTKNIVILEGIDLYNVEPGDYELICLPIRLTGCEGALARAVLIDRNDPD